MWNTFCMCKYFLGGNAIPVSAFFYFSEKTELNRSRGNHIPGITGLSRSETPKSVHMLGNETDWVKVSLTQMILKVDCRSTANYSCRKKISRSWWDNWALAGLKQITVFCLAVGIGLGLPFDCTGKATACWRPLQAPALPSFSQSQSFVSRCTLPLRRQPSLRVWSRQVNLDDGATAVGKRIKG